MAYVTDLSLANQLDLPASTPATLLAPNSWLVLATYSILTPLSLTYQWLQLQVLSIASTNPTGLTTPVAAGRGVAYVGIWLNYDSSSPATNLNLQGTVNDLVIATGLGIFQRNCNAPALVIPGTATPASYSFVLANNTNEGTLTVEVAGQIRLNLSAI